jgi:hypothetical protein
LNEALLGLHIAHIVKSTHVAILFVAAVRDVCEWITSISMAQYRTKFLRHCIDGPLLIQLEDHHLKLELGIGPMGHRYYLLGQIEQVGCANHRIWFLLARVHDTAEVLLWWLAIDSYMMVAKLVTDFSTVGGKVPGINDYL